MRICIPITARTTQQFIRDIKTAEQSDANLLELRLDFLKDLTPENLEKILKSCKFPKIVTIRIKAEGGHWQGTEAHRSSLFKQAIKLGAEFVDLELQSKIRPKGAKLILSYHNFQNTPPLQELEKIYQEMHKQGAHIAKIVTTAQTPKDNWEIFQLISKAPEDTLIAIAMGEVGQSTRISGPGLGSYLTFATLPGLSTSAPGQLSIEKLQAYGKQLILIGGRGSGKSAISNILARQTGRFMVSTDEMIVANARMGIPEIVAQKGWQYFRKLELNILKELSKVHGAIIDCGGGILCDQDQEGNQTFSEERLQLIKQNSVIIWLHCPLATQLKRIGAAENRPSITGQKSAQEELAEVMELRNPWYARAADHKIDTNKHTAEEVVAKILDFS